MTKSQILAIERELNRLMRRSDRIEEKLEKTGNKALEDKDNEILFGMREIMFCLGALGYEAIHKLNDDGTKDYDHFTIVKVGGDER